MEVASVLFPHPDSPTIANISFLLSFNETLSTAGKYSSFIRKLVTRLLISINVSAFSMLFSLKKLF